MEELNCLLYGELGILLKQAGKTMLFLLKKRYCWIREITAELHETLTKGLDLGG